MSLAEVTTDQVERWLVESAGTASASCCAQGPVGAGINSRVFYAECSAFPSPLFVKLCLKSRTSRADPAAAQRQYDALLRVSDRMTGAKEYSVPRPYIVRSDVGLVATEWVEGRSLSEQLLSWRCGVSSAETLMARAGRWIREFHASHPLPSGPLDVDAKVVFVDEMARSSIPDRVFERGLTLLRRHAGDVGSIATERSWIHGDFKPDNLIVSAHRTVGIDLHLRHEGSVIYDLAPFLNELELGLLHPRGWRLVPNLHRLRRRFLESYSTAAGDGYALPLTWLQLFMVLGRWHTGQARIGTTLRFRYARLFYRHMVARLSLLPVWKR